MQRISARRLPFSASAARADDETRIAGTSRQRRSSRTQASIKRPRPEIAKNLRSIRRAVLDLDHDPPSAGALATHYLLSQEATHDQADPRQSRSSARISGQILYWHIRAHGEIRCPSR